MKSIGEFFKKIGGVQAREIALREAIRSSIRSSIAIDIDIADISVRSGTVHIKNISQEARSALFIRKAKVVADANQLQSITVIKDIR